MSNDFFTMSEQLVLLKRVVLQSLSPVVFQFQDYFKKAHRSYTCNHHIKINNILLPRMKLDMFTQHALFFLINARSLVDDLQEYQETIVSVVMSNYKMNEYDASNVLTGLEEIFLQDKNIISFHNKMRKHVVGMLKTHQFQHVMDLYRRHLTPRYYEKKNLGQVFTPFVLIDRILDQIPPEIMSDPNSTFLDPSAGMGGFLVVLYKRLMSSLAHVIKDKEKRHDHIISNMLYAVEITKNNVGMMKKIFGDRLPIFHGDALQMNMEKEFGIKGVRVIVGNPPFEKPQKKESRKVAGDSLWDDFVRKSLDDWLLPDGYFGVLLPPGWRKPSDEKSRTIGLWGLMTIKNKPIWIEMYDGKETSGFFEGKVAIRSDLVVIKKEKNEKNNRTIIRGTDEKRYKEKLMEYPFLPNANLKKWKEVLTTKKSEGTSVLYFRSTYDSRKNYIKKEKDDVFKHPVVHAIHKDGSKVLLYSNRKEKAGGFGVSKIILNEFGGWNKPIIDWNGKYGMSQHTFALPVSSRSEGKEILKYFNQDQLVSFANDMNWSTSRPTISWKMFQYFKKNFWKK